jgi:hypothetical protein
MPGGLASERQKLFLAELFEEPGLAPSTKKSEQCSVNMHGRCYLKHKLWNDGHKPPEEDLLGIAVGETPGGEPLAHFHVTWDALHWVRFDEQPNPRIATHWRVRLCRARDTSSEEVYFWAPAGKQVDGVRKRWPADQEGWIAF